MLRIWKSEIYDSFKCITSACPYNCCDEDWKITIDNDTYNSLSELQIAGLDQCITPDEPHILIKKDHKCPFITPEGLCMIHRDLGENYLSNTCRSYPRFVSGYGDVYTETIGLSCPEVARLLLALDHIMNVRYETFYESKNEKGKKLPFLESESVVQSMLKEFDGKEDLLQTYENLSEKYDFKNDLTERLPEIVTGRLQAVAESVGGTRLYKELNLDKASTDPERIREINTKLFEKYPYLAHNIARNYLYEHIMYQENNREKEYISIYLKAKLAILIFYCAVGASDKELLLSPESVINCLYKTMRLVDQNETVLDTLYA